MGSNVNQPRDVSDDMTFEEAAALLESRNPQPVRRPKRSVLIIYQSCGGEWRASSPQLKRLQEHGSSLGEVKRRVSERLTGWLDPEVRVNHVARMSEHTHTRSPDLLLFQVHGAVLWLASDQRHKKLIPRPSIVHMDCSVDA